MVLGGAFVERHAVVHPERRCVVATPVELDPVAVGEPRPEVLDVTGLDVVRLAAMIVGPGVFGHGLITWATRHLDVTTTSLLTLLSPPLSVIGAWIIFEQQLNVGQLLGGLVVLTGLAGTVAAARYPKTVEPV